jgi:hypothetical protein
MVSGAVPARQCLPCSICHCLSTSRTGSGTSVLANHLLPIEDLHSTGELHVPWPGNTLDPLLWGPSHTQLKQAMKQRGNSL